MKNLKEIIESQNFLVNKKLNNRQTKYEYFPTDTGELQNIIISLLKNGITDLNCIDTSKITKMAWLFANINNSHAMIDKSVQQIDISEWDVSNVTDMDHMFLNCDEFNSDLSKWDVSNVKYMGGMFENCHNFNSDLSNWDVSSCTKMFDMFIYCERFNSDISNWDVSNVTDIGFMFFGCKSFNCNLNKWNTNKVVKDRNTFKYCETLIKNNKIPKWYTRDI